MKKLIERLVADGESLSESVASREITARMSIDALKLVKQFKKDKVWGRDVEKECKKLTDVVAKLTVIAKG